MTRIALAAGGTAGHVYPALAVAAELEHRGVEAIFLGTSHGRERELMQGQQYRLEILPGRPFHGESFAGRTRAVLGVPASVSAARRILNQERIDAVIGFGGYASVGPVLAARTRGIWSAIVEPNAVLGMANRFLSHAADRIYLGVITACDSPKARRVGLPVRNEILTARRTSSNGHVRVLLLDDDLPVEGDGIDVIRASEFAHVADGYSACHLVLGRAGAGTLAEISVRGLPSIIVPRDAAEDHQVRNATIYADTGAAIIATIDDFGMHLRHLIADEPCRRAIGERAATLAAPNASKDLVDDLLRCATS
jgi:UDP-N-acetylglucosamine--N-acetylmuramyl-(pentapeptide) pyrophosphoryl-undecaprenol N-acetylglucosamine transferase